MHLLNTLPQRLDPGATPTFAGLIASSLTSPASTPLTLAGGSSGASLVLGQGTTAADITLTPKGTGEFKWTGSTFRQTAVSPNSTGYIIPGYATGTNPDAGGSRGATIDLINLSSTDQNGSALLFSNSNQLSSAYIFGQNLSHTGRTGNIIFGTANGAAPTERMRIASTGDVTISSTTAGSSGAGALVLQGGISAGNTGSAASYFGGNVTVKSDNTKLQVEGNTASNSTQLLIKNPTTDFFVALDNSTGGSFGKPNAGVIWLNSANKLVFATNNSQRMEISSAGDITATGAATFAGAVAIGNTVSSVSPTSPNRTITMVVGGVTLYIAAKTTND